MNLAKVLGTVVAMHKEESLEGLKFLLLGQVGTDGQLLGGTVVAADAVGAGVGELVLYATGSSARQTKMTDQRPCDTGRQRWRRTGGPRHRLPGRIGYGHHRCLARGHRHRFPVSFPERRPDRRPTHY